jgi:hypothetical protein
MADRFISLQKGEQKTSITEGNATSSEDIELRWDLAANLSKDEVIRALKVFEQHIIESDWPAA